MENSRTTSAEMKKLLRGVHLARYYVRKGESWQDKELVENAEVLLTKLIEEHAAMKEAMEHARYLIDFAPDSKEGSEKAYKVIKDALSSLSL